MIAIEREETQSFCNSLHRHRGGISRYQGVPSEVLFSQASGRFRRSGIYFIGLPEHAVVFVNYSDPEAGTGGRPAGGYWFLDANTGEFEWDDPYMTNQFLRAYHELEISTEIGGPISWVTHYPLGECHF